MTKLHAQMGLFAAIDWVAGHAQNPATVQMIEDLLPGTTGIGQQGWSYELQRFLNKDDLHPLGPDGRPRRLPVPVEFPLYDSAVDELRNEDVAPGEEASPAVQAKTLFASTILSQALILEPDLQLPGRPRTEPVPDPLDELLDTIVTPDAASSSSSSDSAVTVHGIRRPLDTRADVMEAFRSVATRAEYHELTRGLVEADKLPAVVGNQKPVCTGSLRKLHGQFCTLLTTSWQTPYTIAEIQNVIDPHNWPDLCDFFFAIDDQKKLNPDRSRGWTRVLETVTSDPDQWRLRTALRYWKGTTTSGNGFYINYDLDDPRKKDCDLVEVDAGYVWVLPTNDPKYPVALRTGKQVRIRGLSPTATAALGCFMGWGDAMSQMFDDRVTNTKAPRTKFPPPSVDPGAVAKPGSTTSTKDPTDKEILQDAEDVELLDGWRGLMIENVGTTMVEGVGVAAGLATSYLSKWMDGMTVDDVQSFGAQFGTDTTKFATDMFKAAAGALQPTSADLADSTEGKA